MEECLICFSPFTAKVRKAISCPHCDHSSCMQCLQRYLLESFGEPDCPHCRKPWSLLFLRTNLPKSFIDSDFAKRRQDILWAKVQSFIPEVQSKIEREKEAEIYYRESIHPLKSLLVDLEAMKSRLNNTLDESRNGYVKIPKAELENIREKYSRINDQILKLKIETSERKRTHDIILHPDHDRGAGDVGDAEERKQFRRKCSVLDCRGWVNQSWRCGICDNYTCSDCFEVIGKTKEGTSHVCKEENLQTAKLIRKSTKPCPKCGEGIEKVSGCDVMFCVSCHSGFSWKTGDIIERHQVHNPHFFEWVRTREDTNPEVIIEHIMDCTQFNNRLIIRTFQNSPNEKNFERVFYTIRHIEDFELGRYAYTYTTNDLLEEYLLNEKDKDCVQRLLQVRERRYEREKSIREALDVFVQIGKELVMDAVRNREKENQNLTELERLRNFTNENLERIGRLYGCVVPFLTQTGMITIHSPSRKRDDPDGAIEGAGEH